jgi:hypothetical protein
MRCPPNLKDPHGYYREIGVAPYATTEQIRTQVRRLYRAYHPDTGTSPSVFRFNRVRNIATVLLDTDARAKYNATPAGMRLMDAVYESELSKLDGLLTMDESELRAVLRPTKATPYQGTPGRFDFFAVDTRAGDSLHAQRWYHHLVATAPRTGYATVVKVMLCDDDRPAYDAAVHILKIPRRWEPSDFAAYALFTTVAGASLADTPTSVLPFDRNLSEA